MALLCSQYLAVYYGRLVVRKERFSEKEGGNLDPKVWIIALWLDSNKTLKELKNLRAVDYYI